MDEAMVLEAADHLIKNEKPVEAIVVLKSFLLDVDRPEAWLKLARAHMILGEEVVARAILRNVVLKKKNPHIVYIIAAKIPYCKPLVFDNRKLAYFSVPKCGSSTFKDALLILEGEAPHRERSHFRSARFERVLSFAEFDASYNGYTSIMIVRHPRERLRSYWRKNVIEQRSLIVEAGGRESYYGLSTHPSYNDMIQNFKRYREVFLDFRHHTDSIIGYSGNKKDRVQHVFDISSLGQAFDLLNLPENSVVKRIENMKSNRDFDSSICDLDIESECVGEFYKRELAFYFAGDDGLKQ